MVVMKLTLPRSDAVMLNAIPMSQIDWPVSHSAYAQAPESEMLARGG